MIEESSMVRTSHAGLASVVVVALAAFAPAGASAQQKGEDAAFKFMKSEKLGELKLEMPEAEIAKLLPAKPARGREQLWGADGQYHQKWTYGAQGLTLGMVSEKMGAAKSLESITCAARCALKTSRGIGLGSTLADAQKAYAAEFNKEESTKPGVFVAGSIYGGLILNFKGGRVSAMFLGAAAE
jgi:hypothetical protein